MAPQHTGTPGSTAAAASPAAVKPQFHHHHRPPPRHHHPSLPSKLAFWCACSVSLLLAFLLLSPSSAPPPRAAPESPRRSLHASHSSAASWGGAAWEKKVRTSAKVRRPRGLSVLVTGAAGFVGCHAAAALRRRGDGVLGLDNFNDYYDPALKRGRAALLARSGVYVVDGDVADAELLAKLFDVVPFTHVLHLAAQAGVRHALVDPMSYVRTNVGGLVVLFEAARAANPQPAIVWASSSSVYGLNSHVPFSEHDRTDRPASLYAATKKTGEEIAHVYNHIYGLSLTALRFFTVYGPWGRPDMAYFFFTRDILAGQPITVYESAGGTHQTTISRDFTYIDDIVKGCVAALDTAGRSTGSGGKKRGQAPLRTYNLGNTSPVPVTQLVDLLEKLLKVKPSAPPAAFKPAFKPLHLPPLPVAGGLRSLSHCASEARPLYRQDPLFVARAARNDRAAPPAATADGARPVEVSAPGAETARRAKIGVYFATWWALNVIFNIYNKKVLNAFPYPWLTSTLSLAAGSIIMLASWATRIAEAPNTDLDFWKALSPVAIAHTIGHVAATVSMAKVAVSFTHIIKSGEPAFSVLVSRFFLGEHFPAPVYFSLLPIIGGCALAAITELNFNMIGFMGAMISNLAFVFRNIFSKKGMMGKSVSGMNYYACLSMLSLMILLPFAIAMEGPKVWAAGWQKAVAEIGPNFVWWVAAQSVFYHLYNQVSYMSLDEISPLTFSIGNTMKRISVIVASIIIFQTPVQPINALGAAIAILGTFIYSQAK